MSHPIAHSPNPIYVQAANRTADALMAEFPEYDVYWRLGHAFDTLNDYFFTTLSSAKATQFATVILDKFLNRHSLPWKGAPDLVKDPWWYDDFAWWGIAALRAGSHPDIYGDKNAAYFAGVADLSWQPVYRNAPNVWENAKSNPDFKPFEPRFPGGVWNYFFAKDEIAGVPFTPCVPGKQDTLRGIQNTLTNGLYWVLMARLARQRGDTEFRTAADAVLGFFESWFSLSDRDKSLLNHFDPNDLNTY